MKAAVREVEEETGYQIEKIEKVFESYMSPGSVTEILYFFIAEYHDSMKISSGGGLVDEQEDIEVMESWSTRLTGLNISKQGDI